MGRRRKSANPRHSTAEPAMDVSPLIDVGFLLLIYFLVTTTLLKQEADLGLALPGVSSIESDPVEVDQMLIEIAGDGAVYVNDELMDSDPGDRRLPNLTERLQRYAQSAQIAGSDAMVVIECADSAENQRFIDVLNSCAHTGLKNVSLAQ